MWNSMRCRYRRPRAGAPGAFAVLALAALCGIAVRADSAQESLAAKIGAVLADPRLNGATVGVHVQALGTGRVLYDRNGMKALIPASNQKIVTAAVALRELGPDYEFVTALWATGDLRADGAWDGSLILVGGGDPTLTSLGSPGRPVGDEGEEDGSGGSPAAAGVFDSWADAMKARGVRRITGDLLLDDALFDREFVHPQWPADQLTHYYCAPVGALSFQGNCVLVTVEPGAQAGEPARCTLSPDVSCLDIRNLCKTGTRDHSIWFDRKPGSATIVVGGWARKSAAPFTGRVTVADPGLFTGQALAAALRQRGIRLDGQVRRISDEERKGRKDWRPMAHRRTPLSDVLGVMLKESQNTYAEHVLKAVGAKAGGDGSWRGGLLCAAQHLRSLGFQPGEMALSDGSGMARDNKLCATLLCAVLADAADEDYAQQFRAALAAPGEGTLRRRLGEAPYASRVRAKTGYLRGAGALSGYADARSGVRVAFSILINDCRGGNGVMRDIEDRIVRAIVDCAE